MDLYSKLLSFDISQYDMVVIKIYNHSGYMVDFAEFIFADIINYKEKYILKFFHTLLAHSSNFENKRCQFGCCLHPIDIFLFSNRVECFNRTHFVRLVPVR